MPEIVTAFKEHLENPECDNTPPEPPQICIRLPFGLKICSGRSLSFGYEGQDILVLRLFNMLQPMLTPLMMLLVVASMIKALIDCVKAFPKAISQLSPQPIIECLEKLAKYFPMLAEFIPPLTVIGTIIDLTRAVILLVDVLIQAIQQVIILSQRLINFDINLQVFPDLGQYRQCIEDELAAAYSQIASMINAAGPIFSVLAYFLELLDLPGFEDAANALRRINDVLTGADSNNINQDMLDTLQEARDVLLEVEAGLAPFSAGKASDVEIDLS